MVVSIVTRLTVGTCTDVGAVRSRNEDSILAERTDSGEALAFGWLGIVADGLGGHKRGDLASKLAVDTTRDVFYRRTHEKATGDRLRSAVERANEVILRTGAGSAETTDMASTITAAVIKSAHLTVAQVGDSRGYLVRNNRLRQITEDHSLVEELIRKGGLTPEEAAHHPKRNVITRALGTRPTVLVDIFEEELQHGDVVVLCSDGLYRVVEEAEIARALVAEPQPAAESLVALANRRGAPDNVSVVLVHVAITQVDAEDEEDPESTWPSRPVAPPVEIDDGEITLVRPRHA